jgi:hypothetical protein
MVLSPFVSDIRWLMKFLKILGLILAVFVLLLVSLWWACSPHQPSDAELVRQFKMHRTDLDHLVEMMNEDWQMSRIAPDFTWRQDNLAWPRPESEWGITKDRWDDCRSMFRKVGAKGGTTRRQKSSDIIIDIWSWGIVPAGIGVAYLHCGQPRDGMLTPRSLASRTETLAEGCTGSLLLTDTATGK